MLLTAYICSLTKTPRSVNEVLSPTTKGNSLQYLPTISVGVGVTDGVILGSGVVDGVLVSDIEGVGVLVKDIVGVRLAVLLGVVVFDGGGVLVGVSVTLGSGVLVGVTGGVAEFVGVKEGVTVGVGVCSIMYTGIGFCPSTNISTELTADSASYNSTKNCSSGSLTKSLD